MAEQPQHPAGSVLNVETHHEKSDVNVKALIWFVVIFIVFAAVVHVLLWVLFNAYAARARHEVGAPPMTKVARPADLNVPAEPRLQPFPTKEPDGVAISPVDATPVVDMVHMRASEDAQLNTPGWIDPQKGIVRIPIERAKQLVLQRGLPVNPAPEGPVGVIPPDTANAPRHPPASPTEGEPNPARIDTRTTT
jgi:hypothetical protein